MIRRTLQNIMQTNLHKGKAVILYGARQCGKTTLTRMTVDAAAENAVWVSGDDDNDVRIFSTVTKSVWPQILGSSKLVVIDEAQRIPGIGRAVKILTDSFPDVQAILTGSSSFLIANMTEETLTGRKYEYRLYPFSFLELCNAAGFPDERKALQQRLLFGSYPEVVTKPAEAQQLLQLIAGSYLYRDIFEYEGIRKPKLLKDLLRLLAYQVGNEVSTAELASSLSVSRGTVDSYLSLLEQSFIIFILNAYSTNKRNELKKAKKIYFCDNGIRNAVLGDFTPIGARKDTGALWENYLVSERIKYLSDKNALPANGTSTVSSYFWRTTDGMEIDYVEECAGSLSAYEFKWNPGKKCRVTAAFTNRYPDASVAVVTPDTYQNFLGL